jgi:DNA replication protein DnaC
MRCAKYQRTSTAGSTARVYLAPKVLVIDEMGYLPLDDRG